MEPSERDGGLGSRRVGRERRQHSAATEPVVDAPGRGREERETEEPCGCGHASERNACDMHWVSVVRNVDVGGLCAGWVPRCAGLGCGRPARSDRPAGAAETAPVGTAAPPRQVPALQREIAHLPCVRPRGVMQLCPFSAHAIRFRRNDGPILQCITVNIAHGYRPVDVPVMREQRSSGFDGNTHRSSVDALRSEAVKNDGLQRIYTPNAQAAPRLRDCLRALTSASASWCGNVQFTSGRRRPPAD